MMPCGICTIFVLPIRIPKLEYLPITSASFLRMLNQAINTTSKSYCTHHTSCKILDSSETDIFVSVREYWKLCGIAD